MSTALEFISKHIGQQHTHSVIWLHGLGADGHDFAPIADEMRFPEQMGPHFIFPNAAVRPITFSGGMPMHAWYDIKGVELSDREDQEGIAQSSAQIIELIEAEHAKGIAYDKIFLAGFSQGGAMAFYTGLTFQHKLAGMIALSCYLPLNEQFQQSNTEASLATPVLQVHGEFDPVVQEGWGRQSCDLLKSLGYQIEYHRYPMAHQVCAEEIELINSWLIAQSDH